MFAAVKVVIAAAVTCGTLIASVMETAHPRFVACIWVAFAVGVIGAESIRNRRQRSVRWQPRRAR